MSEGNFDAGAFLRQLVDSPGDMDLFGKAAEHFEAIREYMVSVPASKWPLGSDLDWSRRVYMVLTTPEPEPMSAEDQAGLDELLRARDLDVAYFCQALDALVAGLPEPLADKQLLESFKSSQDANHQLALRKVAESPKYGTLGMTVFSAASAISMAFNSTKEFTPAAKDMVSVLSSQDNWPADYPLRYASMIMEISTVAEVTATVAQSIYTWLLEVARVKPYLFPDFKAVADGQNIRLTDDDGPKVDGELHLRWSITSPR